MYFMYNDCCVRVCISIFRNATVVRMRCRSHRREIYDSSQILRGYLLLIDYYDPCKVYWIMLWFRSSSLLLVPLFSALAFVLHLRNKLCACFTIV